MGLRKVLLATGLMSITEWFIYYRFDGRFGIEVTPETMAITVPFMVMANFISATIAQKIFTGKINLRFK